MTVTGYEKGIAGHEVVAIFDNINGTKTNRKCTVSRISDFNEWEMAVVTMRIFYNLIMETWFEFFNRVCSVSCQFSSD